MDGMVFEREGIGKTGMRLDPAVGMALMEELGIPDLIDDACEFDPQRILTPGMAAKAIIGTMFTHNNKNALRNVSLFYSMAPVGSLFGQRVNLRSLNDSALGRNLDTIFEAGTELLFYRIASRIKGMMHLSSFMYHFDPSNVTIARSAGEEYGELPVGAPVPKLGHPKDRSEGQVQYNFCATVDGDGIPVYMKAHDGNIDDTEMIAEAVRFVENLLRDEKIVAVGDGKMVTKALVQHMIDAGTLFASKPPQVFSSDVGGAVAEEALQKGFVDIGRIGKRKDSPEYEVFDTSRECYGNMLRFVAYRKKDRSKIVRHMKRLDGIKVRNIEKSFSQRSFATREEAESEAKAAVVQLKDSAWALHPTIRDRIGGKGAVEWKVSFKPAFDEGYAYRLAEKKVEVIVTNIPRSEAPSGDIREGGTARDVLSVYTGQWHVEGLFSEMKSGLGADEVFFQNPGREAVMLFLLAVGVLVRRVIMIRLRRQYGKGFGIPKSITSARFFLLMQNVDVTLDPNGSSLRLEGSDEDRAAALSFIDALDVDPTSLLG